MFKKKLKYLFFVNLLKPFLDIHQEEASHDALKKKRKTEPYNLADLDVGRGSSAVVEHYEGKFMTIDNSKQIALLP